MGITRAVLRDLSGTRLGALRKMIDRAHAPGKLEFRDRGESSFGKSFSIIGKRQAAKIQRLLLYVGEENKSPMAAFLRETDVSLGVEGRRKALSGERDSSETRMRMVVTARRPEDIGMVVACGEKRALFLTGASSQKPNNWQTPDILWSAGAPDSIFNEQGAVVRLNAVGAATVINLQVPFQVRVPSQDLAEAIARDHAETLISLGIRRFMEVKVPGQSSFQCVGDFADAQSQSAQFTGVVLEVVKS